MTSTSATGNCLSNTRLGKRRLKDARVRIQMGLSNGNHWLSHSRERNLCERYASVVNGIVSHRYWNFALGLSALSSQDQHAPTTDQLSCLSPRQYGRVSNDLATSHDLASSQQSQSSLAWLVVQPFPWWMQCITISLFCRRRLE